MRMSLQREWIIHSSQAVAGIRERASTGTCELSSPSKSTLLPGGSSLVLQKPPAQTQQCYSAHRFKTTQRAQPKPASRQRYSQQQGSQSQKINRSYELVPGVTKKPPRRLPSRSRSCGLRKLRFFTGPSPRSRRATKWLTGSKPALESAH